MVCWTGSGYKIIKSEEIHRKNQRIWYNVMEKDSVSYESFWWYECGDKKYTSFLKAMTMKLIYNEPIRLINETNILKQSRINN